MTVEAELADYNCLIWFIFDQDAHIGGPHFQYAALTDTGLALNKQSILEGMSCR